MWTVRTDMEARACDLALYIIEHKAVLDRNKAERHIRGGNATREKYREKRRRV